MSQAYGSINNTWFSRIKPAITAFKERHRQGDVPPPRLSTDDMALLDSLDQFVADIDRFVSMLVDDVESKVMLQRTLLGVTLFLTLIVVFYTMYWAHTELVLPLLELSKAARRAQQGDLSVRVQHTGDDELGRLGRAFNTMEEDLSKLYKDLEQRVKEKTEDLERSNQSLELLYHSIARLYGGSVSPEVYQLLLHDIERTLGLGHGAVCLVEGDGQTVSVLASTFKNNEKNFCDASSCADCFGDSKIHSRIVDDESRIVSLPLRDAERQYGVLQLEIPRDRSLELWQSQLLEALCRHIGAAIGTAQRMEQNRRLSLLEERATIARELHDSLAQSLAYMKIQVSRLEMALKESPIAHATQPVLTELRTGLNSAYRELRELLTTFRLRIESEGFVAALQKTVDEFSNLGGIPITCETHLTGCHLTPNEEIHLLQIIREALSNIVRHANASRSAVNINCQGDGVVVVTIEDDGIGIEHTSSDVHHYGVAIMNERARGLKGTLTIGPRATGGTQVLLKFHTSRMRRAMPG